MNKTSLRHTFFYVGLGALLLSSCGENPASSANTSNSSSGEKSSSTSLSTSTSPSVSTSHDTSSATTSSKTASSASSDVEDVTYTGKLRIWYHNDVMNYDNMRIYLWNNSVDGAEYEFNGSDAGYGKYFEIDLGTSPQFAAYPSVDIRIIIKYAGTWSGQTLDAVAPFSTYAPFITSEEGVSWMNIYTAAGQNSALDLYTVKNDALGDSIQSASFSSDWKSVVVAGTGMSDGRASEDIGKVASYELYGFSRDYFRLKESEKISKRANYKVAEGSPNSKSFTITLDSEMEPTTLYTLEAYFALSPTKLKSKNVAVRNIFDTTRFASLYTYSGDDLGLSYESDGSRTFKLWAPTCSRVQVNLYNAATPGYLAPKPNGMENWGHKVDMTYGDYGIWSYTLPASDTLIMKRTGYTFIVTNALGVSEVSDPYAKAAGINGVRSAIVDFDSTDPADWDGGAVVNNALPKISSSSELTVYEAHIRDLTADSSWQGQSTRGTFNAFAESGTTYSSGSTTVKTGFDNIKELGVNAVQLLPVFDQSNDERWISSTLNGTTTVTAPAYNWGYNPLNYSVVEGAYSSDPYTPATRITEFKNLIETYAKAGIRIIMDVVYNHVASAANSNLTRIVPQYYLRTNAEGAYTDGTGVGNEVASERPMARKLIVDSVKFWASEYQVKGFRFDLMGCLDVTTMRAVKDALYDIDPQIVVYGEGWTGGSSGITTTPATSDNVYASLTNSNGKGAIGCFNDGGRDGTKGNTTYADVTPSYGFVNQGSDYLQSGTKYNAAKMWMGINGFRDKYIAPDQTVNYVSCHDNYTLYDQLNYTLGLGKGADAFSADAASATVACTASVLFSQGLAFLQGGEEVLRTKIMKKDDPYYDKMVASYGKHTSGSDSWIAGDGLELTSGSWLVRNSYMYGDAVNSYKWDRKVTYKEYFDKMAEAVKLRTTYMNDLFGYSNSAVSGGAVSLWGASDMGTTNTVIAANVASKKSSSAYYLIFGGRNSSTYSSIGIGNGGVQIVYTSSTPSAAIHTDGQSFTISNNLFGAGKYEFCLVKRVSNA
jgi:type I pullulanase